MGDRHCRVGPQRDRQRLEALARCLAEFGDLTPPERAALEAMRGCLHLTKAAVEELCRPLGGPI